MNGVTLGTLHSYDDLFLVLQKKEIGTPETKVKQVEIEGADGYLDYTDYFGEPKYNNRTISLEFATVVAPSTFPTLFSTIQDALHGQKVQVVFDDDQSWYYEGRIAVSSFVNEKGIGYVSMEIDCDPYKSKSIQTTVNKTISGTGTVTLINSRKKVVPTITASAQMTYTFGSITKTVSAGTFTIPEFVLSEGMNTIGITGTGTVSFVYREGRL